MNRTERAVIVWKPQPRQLEFMRRPAPEALYGGAAGGDLLGGEGGLHQLGELGGGEGVADGLEDDLVVSHGVFPFRPWRPVHCVVLFAVARM